MGKDFKIGLACGLILAVIALIWVASRPSLRPEARMARPARGSAAERPMSAPVAPTRDSTSESEPMTLSEHSPGASVQQQHPSQPASPGPPNMPDMTIYERAEKIKTTRFHIVRRDETLSAISQQYYGSPNRWRHILEANREAIKDANKIQPGTKLIIPD